MRGLASAIALGSGLGLAIGGAYVFGGMKRLETVQPSSVGAPLLQAALPTPSHGQQPVPHIVFPASGRPTGWAALRARFRLSPLQFAAAHPFHLAAARDDADLNCLTQVVYYEARGESPAGQAAVAQVVLNRVRHPAFPKTICGVAHQRSGAGCQFTFACKSLASEPVDSGAWRRSRQVAQQAMHGAVMAGVGDATHFQSARGGPFSGLLKVAQIGAHVFYRFAGRAGGAGMFHQVPQASRGGAAIQVAANDRPDPHAVVGLTLPPSPAPAPPSYKVIDPAAAVTVEHAFTASLAHKAAASGIVATPDKARLSPLKPVEAPIVSTPSLVATAVTRS